jgi:glycosyltransferase involved in cell wall biosynthesis
MTPYLQQRALLLSPIGRAPSSLLGIVVVIPAYREPHLLLSLMALQRCELPDCDTEVLVVVNDSEKDSAEVRQLNLDIAAAVKQWASTHNNTRLWFHILYQCGMPAKDAGVGLARKIGMDEACRRLEQAGNPQGVIACFDADSRCAPNYLRALENHFQSHPQTPACSIHFEHPMLGADFPEDVYRAITAYELHLRYFVAAQRFAGFPFAFQTIGSSMAVRCSAYQEQGGMNRRKAGEDFYFLHKFTCHPHFTVLNETTIYPSPRPSDRVPFGTGRAVTKLLKAPQHATTYSFRTFLDLKALFDAISLLPGLPFAKIHLPESVTEFAKTVDMEVEIARIRSNTSTLGAFQQQFFRWFNAFVVMKYTHFARDYYYPDIPIEEAARELLTALGKQMIVANEIQIPALLDVFRNLDNPNYKIPSRNN